MLDFGVVDTHVHLWDIANISYPWLADIPLLNRNYLPADYKEAHGEVRHGDPGTSADPLQSSAREPAGGRLGPGALYSNQHLQRSVELPDSDVASRSYPVGGGQEEGQRKPEQGAAGGVLAHRRCR